MLLHNPSPYGGQDTPTHSHYGAASAASPSDRLSPPSSPQHFPHSDQPLPVFPHLPSNLSAPPPPPIQSEPNPFDEDSVPPPSDDHLHSPPSPSPFDDDEDQLPPPLPPLPSPSPLPLPPSSALTPLAFIPPSSSSPSSPPSAPPPRPPLRLPLLPPLPSLGQSLLSARQLCSSSISQARDIHGRTLNVQMAASHIAKFNANKELTGLQQKLEQANGQLQEKSKQLNNVARLRDQLDAVDDDLLSYLRRRRQAMTKEHISLFRRVDDLQQQHAKLTHLAAPMTVALQRSLKALREGVLVSREADALRRQQEERELREAYDGHLPKLVSIDPDQLERPAWGEQDGWDEVEECTRYRMKLVDKGAAGKSGKPVGPFELTEEKETRRVRVRSDPFGEGAMRLAYLCEDVTECPKDYSKAIRLVAKESRWRKEYRGVLENRREFYTGDIAAQLMGQLLVERFNQLDPPKLVQMLTPMLYCFHERADADRRYMLCELSLVAEGEFQRYTDNESWRNPSFESMMALSHWSHASTDGKWLLCDLQGVGYLLTDPQIHSLDDRWGQGDIGATGMTNFFSSHFCNDICSKLKLKPHAAQPKEKPDDFVQGETKAKELYDCKVIGVCGHVFMLGVKERKAWLKSGQRMQCPGCRSHVDEGRSFFGWTIGRG